MVSISCLCEVGKGHFENRSGSPFHPALLLFFLVKRSTSPPMLHYMLFMGELMREIHIFAHLRSLLLENTVFHPFNVVLEISTNIMLQPYHATAHSVLPFFQPCSCPEPPRFLPCSLNAGIVGSPSALLSSSGANCMQRKVGQTIEHPHQQKEEA